MANAVSPTCGTVAALVGAGAGYGVRRVLGPGDPADAVVVLVAALGYAVSALLARRMQRELLGPAEPATLSRGSVLAAGADLWRDIFAGARHVKEKRPAAYALSAIGAHRVAYGITTIGTVLLCRNYFSDPADVDAGLAKLALVFGASAAGIATAAILTPITAGRFGAQGWITIAITLAVGFQLVFVVHPSELLMYVTAYTINFIAQTVKICVDAIVQETVDDAFRGRVFSFYDVVFNVAFVASAGLSVLLVPADGFSRPLFAGLAVLYAATALGYGLALRAERRRDAAGAPITSTRPQQLVEQQ
jgi:hypothetical protein